MIVLSKAKKRKHYIEPKPADFEEAEKAEDETETEDIYNTKERERMLEEDEITAAEEAFVRGREEVPNKKVSRKKSHDDDVSVELSQKEAEED